MKIHQLFEITCPICRKIRLMKYKQYWAINSGKAKSTCFKCSRFKKGETNSGGFKKGHTPSNKGQYKKCPICGIRITPCSKTCHKCWVLSTREKKNIKCLICGNIFYSKDGKGKFCSRGCFKKSGVWIKIGKEHNWWKGGVWKKPKYGVGWRESLRCAIRQRDKFVCQLCGFPQGKTALDVHHIDYDKNNCNPTNLVTLCKACHSKTKFNRDKWKKGFEHCVGLHKLVSLEKKEY